MQALPLCICIQCGNSPTEIVLDGPHATLIILFPVSSHPTLKRQLEDLTISYLIVSCLGLFSGLMRNNEIKRLLKHLLLEMRQPPLLLAPPIYLFIVFISLGICVAATNIWVTYRPSEQ